MVISLILVSPLLALGANPLVPCGNDGQPDCDWSTLLVLANTLITFLIEIAAALAAISFAYSGWLFLTAGGDAGKVSRAKGIFGKVAIGFFFCLAAWLIVFSLLQLLGAKSGIDLLHRPS